MLPRSSPSVSSVLVACCSVTVFIASLVFVMPAGAQQEGGDPDAPRLHQPGKDVQWVPTPEPLVEKMLDLAGLTAKDTLVDLGSGDGVLVMAAAKRGAQARGIEYDRGLVEYSRRKAKEAGLDGRVKFIRGDIFKTDFSDATVVTTFLLPSMNLRLRPTFLRMKPGTRIVANTFAIAEWQPDETVALDQPCERWCTALMWIVPAPVTGSWLTPRGDLTLAQKFQVVSGSFGKDAITDGRLRGDAIAFTAAGVRYTGRVDGTKMKLTATVEGKPIELNATALVAARH